MVKNGWRFVNSYQYNDLILNFVKEDRSSNIGPPEGSLHHAGRDMGRACGREPTAALYGT